jgi:adenylate cyclase
MKLISLFSLLISLIFIPATAQQKDFRLAVLPFENLTKQTQNDWIGKGIADSLTQSLSCVSAIRIIERAQLGQVMQEQELSLTGIIDDKSAVQVGKLLSANKLLSGSFQISKNTILINARIIDAETGEVDKSKIVSVSGDIGKIFDLYEQLSVFLIDRLNVTSAESEKQKISQSLKTTSSLKAYEEYSKGRESLLQYTGAGYKQAAEHFDNAILEDPSYAPAYAWLAESLALLANEKRIVAQYIKLNGESDKEKSARENEYNDLFIKAQGYAKTSVSLAPSLPESHRAAAVIYFYSGENTQAKIEAQTLLALNKNDPLGYYIIGSMDDDLERGLKFINKALQLDPNFGKAYLDTGYYFEDQGNYKKAADEYQKGIKVSPSNPDLRKVLGVALFRLKNYGDAEIHFDKSLKYRNGDAYVLLCNAVVKFRLGKLNDAQNLFKKAYKLNWNFYSFPVVLKEKFKWDSAMLNDWGKLRDASK